jgi:hypothetical protein
VRSRTCGCQQRVWRCAKLVERNPASNDVAADLARVVSIATSVFLTIGGDLTESGKVGELRRYRDAVNSLCVPVFSLFGGHDGIEERCAADVTRTGRYEQFLGPAWYSFDWGGWHFVMYPNEEECFSKVDRRHMRQWLEQDLSQQASDRPILLTTHSDEIESIQDFVSTHNVVLVLFGHSKSECTFAYSTISGAPSVRASVVGLLCSISIA